MSGLSVLPTALRKKRWIVRREAESICAGIKPMIGKLGPALGTHGGPGTILVAIQQEITRWNQMPMTGEENRLFPSLQSIKESISQRKQKDVHSSRP